MPLGATQHIWVYSINPCQNPCTEKEESCDKLVLSVVLHRHFFQSSEKCSHITTKLPPKSLSVSQSWPLALAWEPRGLGGPAAAARGPQLEQEHRTDPAGRRGYPESVLTQECRERKCVEGLMYGDQHVGFWRWAWQCWGRAGLDHSEVFSNPNNSVILCIVSKLWGCFPEANHKTFPEFPESL